MTTQDADAPRVDQRVLLTHAVLVGLTPLIPVPFLDDVVKGAIERRLVRAIAQTHGRALSKTEVEALTEEPSGNLLWSIGKGVVLFPFKLLFKAVFLVLEVKKASDAASRCYHQGLLLDWVLRSKVLAPTGPRSASEVRIAVTEVVSTTTVSPLGRAITAVFESSRDGLTAIGRSLLARIGKGGRPSAAVVEGAVDETAEGDADGPMERLIARLSAAVDEVPVAHFEALEKQLESRLGVPLHRPD